jgi:predicted lipoprotein
MNLPSFRFNRFFLSLMAAVLLISCDKSTDEDEVDNFDRQALLINLADNIIMPVYDTLASNCAALQQACEMASSNPSAEDIALIKTAWLRTLTNFQAAAPYDFGPASNLGMSNVFNLFPVDTDKIQNNINTGSYNLESADNLAANGLQAMDYILYGQNSSNENLAIYFQSNPATLTYLSDIATLLNDKAQSNLQQWQNGYRSTFINATGVDLGSSLGLLVNGGIKYFETQLRDAKIGIPAGARSSDGMAMPNQSEALYNGEISRDLLAFSIESFQNLFNGTSQDGLNGQGLDDYLFFLGAKYENRPLGDEINDRFDASISLTEQLDPAISNAVINNQNACLDVFSELQRIIVLLKVDMTSAMGIQITFVDNDGD